MQRYFANIKKNLSEDEVTQKIETCKAALMQARNKRIRPQLDDKILLGWNALMNIAYSKAYAATGETLYKETAIKNAEFIETRFKDPTTGGYFHTYKNRDAKYPAFLDDYATLASAFIHLQEITGNSDYLHKAKKITDLVIEKFLEEEAGFFFFTADDQKDVIIRKKEIYDGATPSGNSTMALNLHYLGIVYNDSEWVQHAMNITLQLANAVVKYPTSFGNWATALQQFIYGVPEIAVTGVKAHELLQKLLQEYIPIRVLQASTQPLKAFPLLEGKDFKKEHLIYVCKDYSCQRPIGDLREIKSLLK
jgi:hypothetical protein